MSIDDVTAAMLRMVTLNAMRDLREQSHRIVELAEFGVITVEEAAAVLEAALAGGRVGIAGARDLTEWARDQILLGKPCEEIVRALVDPENRLLRLAVDAGCPHVWESDASEWRLVCALCAAVVPPGAPG